MASEAGGAMYAAAQAAGGDDAAAGPDFTKASADSADDAVVDAEVVDEGPAEEQK